MSLDAGRQTQPTGPTRRDADTVTLVRYAWRFVLLGTAYFLLALIGLHFARISGAGSPVWPAAGVALAGLVIGGHSLWPAIFLARLLAGQVTGSDLPLWVETLIAGGNAFAAWLPAIVLDRLRVDPHLGSLSSMMRYLVLGVGLSALIAASIGTLVLWKATGLSDNRAAILLALWTSGNFAGALLTGPLIQVWWRRRLPEHALQLAAFTAVLVVLCSTIFLIDNGGVFRNWHILPAMLVAALAFQLRGASLAVSIVGIFSLWGLTSALWMGHDPALVASVPLAQQFLAIAGVTVLVLGAVDEERRRRSEDRLQLALDATEQGIFEYDARAGLMNWDNQSRQLFGLVGGDAPLRLHEMIERVHSDDRATVDKGFRAALDPAGPGQYAGEIRVERGDSDRWLAIHGRTRFQGDGHKRQAVRMNGTLRDITPMHLAQTRLAESERFTRRVLDNLFAFVGVLTPDGTLVQSNRPPLDAAGLVAEDVLGNRLWETWWWSYDPEAQGRIRAAVEGAARGEISRFDIQMRVRNGDLIWLDFQLAPLRDGEGRITHLIPSGMDLTERVAAEASRDRLIGILDATPDFVAIVTPEGRLAYLNPGGRALCGVQSDEPVLGDPITRFLDEDTTRSFIDIVLPEARRHGMYEGESLLVTGAGETIPVSQVVVAHFDARGQVVQYSTIMRDIAEQKQSQERQAELLRELSHRVKNLLAVIQSMARQTLRGNPEPAAFTDVFLGRIASLGISHALLTDADWSGVPLRDIVVAQLQPMLLRTPDRLTTSGAPVLLPPEPATQLGLVFHELGSNAQRYGALSGSEGRVVVEWAWEPPSGDPGIRRLRITWRELGGPRIADMPRRRGFGTALIEMSVRDVERRFEPDGMVLTFTLTLPATAAITREA